MDWVARGSQPGFSDLVTKHLGADKAEKVIKVFALTKIFSLAELKSLLQPGASAETSKTKFADTLHSTSTRHILPPL